jgi:hypothetical protein
MSPHTADIQAVSRPTFDAQEQRVLALRRAFQRALNRKPTVLQRALIDAAAVMQVKFEAASNDPTISANDLVRLSGESRRARSDMLASFNAAAKRAPENLDQYVARTYHRAGA